jgi:CRISPR/Cas system CSM-associated protein Csm3 (group 7 of RAMP superfamily)
MSEYIVTISLESNCLLGSGEGWGSVVDADIVFDNIGLPYFPARRLKGCIRESAKEVLEMMECAGIKKFNKQQIDLAFGRPGETDGANVIFNNLYLPNYKDVVSWCSWALQEFKCALSPEVIVNSFTNIRQQTSINDKGIAEDKSLRTFRVLKSGLKFEGSVMIKKENTEILNLLALSCSNLRYVGTMRNRGYGKVTCSLKKGDMNLSTRYIEQLEKEVI